jgi:hypothetical protein
MANRAPAIVSSLTNPIASARVDQHGARLDGGWAETHMTLLAPIPSVVSFDSKFQLVAKNVTNDCL